MSLSTINTAEIRKFEDMAATWWDEEGPMKVLHRFNPVRLRYIRDKACLHFGRDDVSSPLKGLSIVDIGCGGGVLCEPLTRLGAQVTGLDPAEKNIVVAQHHAQLSGLKIDYRAQSAEMLAERGEQFDIVLAMEVIEHVENPELFVKSVSALVKPGGLLFMATLNRTARSFAFAIIGAEYVLRWLPRGTHDWTQFVTPSELRALITQQGLNVSDTSGVVYAPLRDEWRLSRDVSVNYMMAAEKKN
jgi:2-polyprenyl-6-hydroxyphenyl methylase / 3-demethylubiquinone-9 3-methyltransferase